MSKEMSKETTKTQKAVYTCQKSPVVALSLLGPVQLIRTAKYVQRDGKETYTHVKKIVKRDLYICQKRRQKSSQKDILMSKEPCRWALQDMPAQPNMSAQPKMSNNMSKES